jgi:hypothetical protein
MAEYNAVFTHGSDIADFILHLQSVQNGCLPIVKM